LYAGTEPSVLVSSLLSPNSGVLVFSTVLSEVPAVAERKIPIKRYYKIIYA
jgi:hypothetical protein